MNFHPFASTLESSMPLDKLTPDEITKVVAKIRQRYDEYIFKYFRPKTVKFAFEERYAEVLQKRMDISTFLMAEIGAVGSISMVSSASAELTMVRLFVMP